MRAVEEGGGLAGVQIGGDGLAGQDGVDAPELDALGHRGRYGRVVQDGLDPAPDQLVDHLLRLRRRHRHDADADVLPSHRVGELGHGLDDEAADALPHLAGVGVEGGDDVEPFRGETRIADDGATQAPDPHDGDVPLVVQSQDPSEGALAVPAVVAPPLPPRPPRADPAHQALMSIR